MSHRRPRRRAGARLAAVASLATALVVASLGLGGTAPAQADAASPTLVSFTDDPSLPIQVSPTAYETPEPVRVHLDAGPSQTEVTVTASGAGLDVERASQTFTTSPGTNVVTFDVSGATPGLHTLELTATTPGAAPAVQRLPYVWTAGGARLPGGDSLAGRSYAANGTYTDYSSSEGSGDRYSVVLTFVDATHAVHGLPGHLSTACRGDAARHCMRYAYDDSTGLVQVGPDIIGQLHDRSYLDGATPAATEDTGEVFDGRSFRRLTFPSPGQRYAGTWGYLSRYDRGVYRQNLTLRRDGTYSLLVRAGVGGTYAPDSYLRRDWSGRYQVGPGGRLVLRDSRGQQTYTVARLAIASTRSGKPKPAGLGIELQVSLRITQGSDAGRTLVDGNLMAPRR